ncbi:MAG: hypothetical protein ACREVN_04925 [Gammaproteobacteria bacterium]
MRLTDDRYARERAQFELALRMIRHEARTMTIRACTGLSDDRIRKLYATYFKPNAQFKVKRRRGKSPRQTAFLVRSAQNQLESTTLVILFALCALVRVGRDGQTLEISSDRGLETGLRFCRAYETYARLHSPPRLSFEWAWNLLGAITRPHELYLSSCGRCENVYVQDALALDPHICPCCRIKSAARPPVAI